LFGPLGAASTCRPAPNFERRRQFGARLANASALQALRDPLAELNAVVDDTFLVEDQAAAGRSGGGRSGGLACPAGSCRARGGRFEEFARSRGRWNPDR
jgi:hypothetical protein